MNRHATRIYEHLLGQITGGGLGSGARVPPETDLARTFGTNRMNAHQAIVQLQQQGLITSTRGRGTFVAGAPSPISIGRARRRTARRVHAVTPPNPRQTAGLMPYRMEAVFGSLERAIRKHGLTLARSLFPDPLTREGLRTLMNADIAAGGSSALVLFAETPQMSILAENLDLLFHYHQDTYLIESGGISVPEWPFHMVSLDKFGEGAVAGEYMLALGWEQLVCLDCLTMMNHHWALERRRGFEMAVRAASDGAREVASWKYPQQGAYEAVAKRLARNRGRIALMAVNDIEAARVLDAAARAGLDCPRDFALIAFDDDPSLQHYNLTTVAPDYDEAGTVLAHLIVEHNPSAPPAPVVSVKVRSHLIERATCRRCGDD
ncbi:MAG: substrate-binding domain-containing protein [Kiritimatiellae bacterium]|nr:substrate-binding domain-containing protein [Kiritimatiellia bacterium]